MGALAPLINQTLQLFDITYSPADSAGRIFVTGIKKRPDACEEVEKILRKTAHWEGGRSELSQLVRILQQG